MTDSVIQTCPVCRQQLRLPLRGEPLRVTCPKCRSSWDAVGEDVSNVQSTRRMSVVVALVCLSLSAAGCAGVWFLLGEAGRAAEQFRRENQIDVVDAKITGRSENSDSIETDVYMGRVVTVNLIERFVYSVDGHEYSGTQTKRMRFGLDGREKSDLKEGEWLKAAHAKRSHYTHEEWQGQTTRVYYRASSPGQWHPDPPEPVSDISWYFCLGLTGIAGILKIAFGVFAIRLFMSLRPAIGSRTAR